MLLRLIRTHLAPYRRPIAAIVALQFIGTLAMLYLPSLNAEIIDNGRRARRHGLHHPARGR